MDPHGGGQLLDEMVSNESRAQILCWHCQSERICLKLCFCLLLFVHIVARDSKGYLQTEWSSLGMPLLPLQKWNRFAAIKRFFGQIWRKELGRKARQMDSKQVTTTAITTTTTTTATTTDVNSSNDDDNNNDSDNTNNNDDDDAFFYHLKIILLLST